MTSSATYAHANNLVLTLIAVRLRLRQPLINSVWQWLHRTAVVRLPDCFSSVQSKKRLRRGKNGTKSHWTRMELKSDLMEENSASDWLIATREESERWGQTETRNQDRSEVQAAMDHIEWLRHAHLVTESFQFASHPEVPLPHTLADSLVFPCGT